MRPYPVVSHHPTGENSTKELELEYLSLFPACAVTRSMSYQNSTSKSDTSASSSALDSEDNFPGEFSLKDFFDNSLIQESKITHTPSSDTWHTIHQVVLPQALRNHALAIAHANIAGHLGVTKTYHKIFEHYYWPRMKHDVGRYCCTCHTCKVKGKPGPGVPLYPLIPIPVVDEPFSKIVM